MSRKERDMVTHMADHTKHLTRREVLIAGTGAIGAAALVGGAMPVFAQDTHDTYTSNRLVTSGGSLPVKQIEAIMETNNGTVMNGVLAIELIRTDLHVIGPVVSRGSQPLSLPTNSTFSQLAMVGQSSTRR